MRTCCKAFQQHSNVERAQCAVSTRGSRPMKRWERVKKRGGTRRGGGWDVFRERDRGRDWREGEGEIPDTHQQTGGHTKRELKKKTGHIPQAPENVLVILGRVLLIDEWGVFKPLPLWSCSNGDCTWQAAECSATFVMTSSPIRWDLASSGAQTESRAVPFWIWEKILSRFFFRQYSLFFFSLFLILFFENPNALCTLLLHSAFGYSLAVHDSFTYINETPRWEAGVIGPVISVYN